MTVKLTLIIEFGFAVIASVADWLQDEKYPSSLI